jgi:hypothetical protein
MAYETNLRFLAASWCAAAGSGAFARLWGAQSFVQ